MNILQYQIEAEHTKSSQFHIPKKNPGDMSEALVNQGGSDTTDLLHAIIGIATEGGELLDPVKKMMFYGKQLDVVNLDEEIGDILWYIAIYCTARKTTIEQIAEMNNRKLKARYPDKFTSKDALHRDLTTERRILESY